MTDKELDALIGEFAARFTLIQRKYLRRVGERLKRIGGLSAKDIHILSELRRMGTEMDEIQQEISRACGVSKEQLRSALDLAAKVDTRAAEMKLKGTEEAEESDEGASPDRLKNLTLTPGLKSAVEAQAKVTAGEFDNLSQTTVQDDFYRHVIDAAAGAVTSGVDDYASAIRGAVKTLAANGLKVVYESGYTRRLDSAVRQNVLDAARAVSQAATDEVGRQLGADGVQISAHILCAPDHLPYQGRMYSNEEFEAIQDSLDRPFGMWNCRHIWYPAILGVTKQTYSEDTLKRYADLSNAPVTIGSQTLTRYEWTQQQRRLETKLRDLRAEEAVWLAAGNTEELNRVRAEIRRLTAAYNLITREASLSARMERTEAVMPADLTNGPESGIINSREARVVTSEGIEAYRYPKSDIVQKMSSFSEINEHFSTIDRDGGKHYLFSGIVRELPLESQKALAESVLYMQENFKAKEWPSTIRVQKTATVAGREVAGYYEPKSHKIVISMNGNRTEGELYSTAIHELVHHYDRYGRDAEACVKQAEKEAQRTINPLTGRPYSYADVQLMRNDIAGESRKDNGEILAYSVERNMLINGQNTNPLSQAVYRLFCERNARQ